jgi:hypothetical protein
MPPRIVVGLDPGTKYMGIAAQHFRDDSATPKDTPIHIVQLSNAESSFNPDLKQIALYLDSGHLIFGKDVSKTLRDRQDLQDRVLEFLKLALHSSFDHFLEVSHTKKVLDTQKDRGKLQDCYTDLLKLVLQSVRDYYKTHETNLDVDEITAYFDNIQVEVQMTVPAMWEDAQRGIMRNAARNAGFAKVELREEPLCSAIISTDEILTWGRIKVGQSSLHLDCGSGTLDISVVKVEQVPSDSQDMVLSRVGKCSGNAAGSQMLNQQLLDHINSGSCPDIGEIDEFSTAMGKTVREILRQASDQFDRVKEDFPNDRRPHVLTILGDKDAPTATASIVLPDELISGWYNAWTRNAAQLLRSHIAYITRWAVKHELQIDLACVYFSGGGINSEIFREAMTQVIKETWPDCPIYSPQARLPCAQGALKYHTFQEDSLPSPMNFFLGLDEIYSQNNHGGAYHHTSKWNDRVQIVPGQLKCLMKYSNGAFSDQRLIAATYHVKAGPLGRLEMELFWSPKFYPDSSPSRDHLGKLRKGIRAFPLSWADIDDLGQCGFTAVDHHGISGKHYIVKTWVEMSEINGKLILTLYIMKHNYKFPWKANGEIRLAQPAQGRTSTSNRDKTLAKIPLTSADLADDDWIDKYTVEVWDKDSSHFVTSSTGTCISRGDQIDEDGDEEMGDDMGDDTEEDTEDGIEDRVIEDTEGGVDEDVEPDDDEDMDESMHE